MYTMWIIAPNIFTMFIKLGDASVGMDVGLCTRRREEVKDYFCKSVLFYWAGTGDRTQVIRLGGRCFYLLSHLTVPRTCCLS